MLLNYCAFAWVLAFVLSLASLLATLWLILFGVIAWQNPAVIVSIVVLFTLIVSVSGGSLHRIYTDTMEEVTKHGTR